MATRLQQGQRTLDERAKDIGARLLGELTQARRMAGWSERQLAQQAGVDRKSIVRLEAGSGSVETLIAVMGALRFQLAEIGVGSTLGEKIVNRRIKRKLPVATIAGKTQLAEPVIEGLEKGCGSTSDLFLLLALVAPKVRRRAPERAYWSLGDKLDRDSRFTPPEFMEAIYDAFGHIDLDPCAHAMSPVVATRRIMLADGGDGLTEPWSGRLAFVNPPYSAQLDWLKRAHQQWSEGDVQTVVCLVPVRTDNKFFHATLHKDADLFLLEGRLRFASVRGDVQPTPFSLWVVTFGATAEQKARFAKLVRGCWFRAAVHQVANDQVGRHDRGRQTRTFGTRRLSRLRRTSGTGTFRLRLYGRRGITG